MKGIMKRTDGSRFLRGRRDGWHIGGFGRGFLQMASLLHVAAAGPAGADLDSDYDAGQQPRFPAKHAVQAGGMSLPGWVTTGPGAAASTTSDDDPGNPLSSEENAHDNYMYAPPGMPQLSHMMNACPHAHSQCCNGKCVKNDLLLNEGKLHVCLLKISGLQCALFVWVRHWLNTVL